MLSGTLRELSAEFAGGVEVQGMSRCSREAGWGRGPACRKSSDLRRSGLTEPSTRSVCADGSKIH